MVKKIIIPLVVFVMSLLSCNDESPTGPKPIDPDKIQGTWQVVKMIETCESESEEVDYSKMFLVIDANQIAFWSYEFSDCVDYETSSYTLSGNSLGGEDFEGEENIDGEAYKWSTTVAFDGDNLVITYTETVSYYGESETYGLVTVFQRYNGSVPPIDWPEEKCDSYWLAKKKVTRNGRVLSWFSGKDKNY